MLRQESLTVVDLGSPQQGESSSRLPQTPLLSHHIIPVQSIVVPESVLLGVLLGGLDAPVPASSFRYTSMDAKRFTCGQTSELRVPNDAQQKKCMAASHRRIFIESWCTVVALGAWHPSVVVSMSVVMLPGSIAHDLHSLRQTRRCPQQPSAASDHILQQSRLEERWLLSVVCKDGACQYTPRRLRLNTHMS